MYSEDQVYKVLSSAGIKVIRTAGPCDFSVFCPFHNNRRTPAGEVSHESGIFYCFSCKRFATLEDFIVASTGLTYFQALRLIEKHEEPSSIIEQVTAILEGHDLPDFGIDKIEKLHENLLRSERAMSYLESRGITRQSMTDFTLGYSVKQDMVTFPYMSPDGSKYIGVEGRSVEGKRFMAGGPKSETLFNLRNRIWSEDIFLTESVIDCMRLEQVGCPAVSSMGANRSKVQIHLLGRYFNMVYIVQDNDTAENSFAGQAAAAKLLDKLGDRGIIVKPPERYKDIGEMSDEEIKLLVARTYNLIEGL